MRVHGKIDRNQTEIVKALRQIGCSVHSLASVGSGVPDLLVGYHGVTMLMEVKDGKQPQSRRTLTVEEKVFFERWRGGPCWVVQDVDSALEMVKKFCGNSIPKPVSTD